ARMFAPFEMTHGAIVRLDEKPLVSLCNRLVWNDARRAGVPPQNILISLRTKAPDGGIDADTDSGALQGEHVPTGRTAWQFKKTWKGPASLTKVGLVHPSSATTGNRLGINSCMTTRSA